MFDFIFFLNASIFPLWSVFTIWSGKLIQYNLQRGTLPKKLAQMFVTLNLCSALVQSNVVQVVCHYKWVPLTLLIIKMLKQGVCLS